MTVGFTSAGILTIVINMFENCFECPFLSRYFKMGKYCFYKCSGEHFKKKKINTEEPLVIVPPEGCPYSNKYNDAE